jgi:hypothetical protein
MNSGLYDLFLQNIERAADYINGLDEQTKADNVDTIKQAVENLNNQAPDFSQFIAQDPQRYDSAVNKLKQALSYNSDLANSVVPSAPLIPAQDEAPADAPQEPLATPTDATQPATPAEPATASEPNQETLNSAFAKYMGSSYNPNSSMDKGKMETVKNALKKFQEENDKPFDINDSEDLTKMRPIMNAAYQSEEYKKVAGVGTRSAGGGQGIGRAAATPRQQGTIQPKSLQLPVVGRGVEQMYVDKGGKFVPATDADYNSGQQLYAQKKKGTFDFLRSPKDRFQKVTRNRVERATRP